MSSRSNSIWSESPVERLLMKMYRVPDAMMQDRVDCDPDAPVATETVGVSPKEARAVARQALQRELARASRNVMTP